jgi:hypothetical protein
MQTTHRPSFPTCLFHPRSIHLLCHLDNPSAANLPCLGLQQQTGLKVSRLCGSYKVHSKSPLFPLRTLSPRERRSQRKPHVHPTSNTLLTWRECFITGHKPYAIPHCTTAITHGNNNTPLLSSFIIAFLSILEISKGLDTSFLCFLGVSQVDCL